MLYKVIVEILRHLELTTDPDKPELFRKENRKQVEHFLRTYLKVCFFTELVIEVGQSEH